VTRRTCADNRAGGRWPSNGFTSRVGLALRGSSRDRRSRAWPSIPRGSRRIFHRFSFALVALNPCFLGHKFVYCFAAAALAASLAASSLALVWLFLWPLLWPLPWLLPWPRLDHFFWRLFRLRQRETHEFQQIQRLRIVGRAGHNCYVIPCVRLILSSSISGKIVCSAMPTCNCHAVKLARRQSAKVTNTRQRGGNQTVENSYIASRRSVTRQPMAGLRAA